MKTSTSVILILLFVLLNGSCGKNDFVSSQLETTPPSSMPVKPKGTATALTDELLAQFCAEGVPLGVTAWWMTSPAAEIFQSIESRSEQFIRIGSCLRKNSFQEFPFENSGNFCGFEYGIDGLPKVRVTLNFPETLRFDIVNTKYGEVVSFVGDHQPGLALFNSDGTQKQLNAFLISSMCKMKADRGGFLARMGDNRALELYPEVASQ